MQFNQTKPEESWNIKSDFFILLIMFEYNFMQGTLIH